MPTWLKTVFISLGAIVAIKQGENLLRAASSRLNGDAEAKQKLIAMLPSIEDPAERERVQAIILAL